MNIYNEIENAIRAHVSQLVIPQGITQSDVYQSVRQIMRENPDIFWFSHQWEYIENEHIIHFHYTIGKDKTIKAKTQINDVVQKDFGINKVCRLSVNEQIMYVYKWIALYCKYNIYSAYNQTIYSVFVSRNSVCTGYAKAAQYLFNRLGIESKLVFGTMHNAEKGSRHCWLIVNVNSHWYHFDPTFATPEISDLLQNACVKPVFGAEGLVYNYFCCDMNTIKQSRIVEDEIELPESNSCIDYKPLQNLPVQIHRNNQLGLHGVMGCLLSEVGNSASVYLWHDVDNVQKVVKLYKNDGFYDLMAHEYDVMRELKSCSSVIHVFGIVDNENGIIMEQATPLADLLCSHYYQLSATNFCRLLLDVLAGLQDCLDHGIYYRDIHLNNIYRTSDGRYILGDFGSCQWIEKEKTNNDGGVGSPWYVAPETYLKGLFNESSATYGIGMLAYFLLNDLFPPLWKEYGENSLRQRISGFDLPAPGLLKHPKCAFEQQLLSVIIKSLSFESDKRYQRLSDLGKAIKQCMSLAENNDYLLIDGGSSERLFEFDNKECLDGKSNNAHTNFHSTCITFSDVLVSNGDLAPISPLEINDNTYTMECNDRRIDDFATTCRIDDRRINDFATTCRIDDRRINDFATTAAGPANYSRNAARSYQPQFHPNKKKFWSNIFGKKEDDIYSSVFAPAEVKPKSHLLIQVYLHLFEESERVKTLAKETDKDAERKDYIPLQCKLKKGDKVDVLLNIYGESLAMSDKKSVVWQSTFTKCSFDYFVPKETDVNELSCMVVLTVNNALVGEMRFVTRIVEEPRKLNSNVFAHQYKKIFISYAHQDESKVEPMARAYRAQGVNYFFDRHYLKPGEVFPLKIQEFIDTADLFILCWSENAAKSNYVELERKRALERAFPNVKPIEKAMLTIYPMSIEPRAELPVDMRDIYNFEVI